MLAQNGVVVAQAEAHAALSTPMVTGIMLLALILLSFGFYAFTKINVYPIVQKAIHGLWCDMNKIWRPTAGSLLVRYVRFSNRFYTLAEVLDPAPLG